MVSFFVSSSKPVQFKFSLVFFILLLLFSVAVGTYVRLLIQSRPIGEEIAQALADTRGFDLSAKNVDFQFRRGWAPVVAVSIGSLVGKQEGCFARRIVAENILVSLDIGHLLAGDIKPRRVGVDSLLVTWPEICEVQGSAGKTNVKVAPELEKLGSAFKNAEGPSTENVFDRYADTIEKLKIPELRIQELKVLWLKTHKRRLVLNGTLEVFSDQKEVHLKFIPKQVTIKKRMVSLNRGELSVRMSKNKIELQLQALVREGQLRLKGTLFNDEQQTTKLHAEIQKMPVSVLSQIFFEEVPMRYLWMNCSFSLESPLATFLRKEFALENCDLNGPYGQAKVEKSILFFRGLKHLAVRFDKMNLDELVSGRRNLYLSGIFSKFGYYSGRLEIDDKKNWMLQGDLRDSEILFSRNSLRDIQKMNRIPFEIRGDENQIKISTSSVELNEGEFEGRIDVTLSEDKQNGKVDLELSKFALNPRLYKLMLGISPTPFSVNGQLQIQKQKVGSWEVLIDTKRFESWYGVLNGVKVETFKKNGTDPMIKVSAKKGLVPKKSVLAKWFQPTTLEYGWPHDDVPFEEFSVNLELVGKKQWRWRRGYARLVNNWQFSSEGLFDEAFDIDGWLQWDVPNKPVLGWVVAGHWDQPKWLPREEWMKNWLSATPKFLSENPSVVFENPPVKVPLDKPPLEGGA